ncbi:MAG TPA: hypothetical protein VGC65_02090 [Bacteroidia bacterium]|jgi:fatty acid desaturase
MRLLDFTGQTLMLAAALFSLAFGKEGVILIAFVQFFMGVWQLLSAIIYSVREKRKGSQRVFLIRIFWLSVLVYFLGLTLLGLFMKENGIIYFWFFSAWIIAVYYYVITIHVTFKDPERKTFLDIAN